MDDIVEELMLILDPVKNEVQEITLALVNLEDQVTALRDTRDRLNQIVDVIERAIEGVT